jgi:hypothetical protein
VACFVNTLKHNAEEKIYTGVAVVNIQRARLHDAAVLLIGTALLASSVFVYAQSGMPKRGPKSQVHTDVLPLFQIAKIVKFKLVELPKTKYNFSRAELAMAPVGFAKIKKPQYIVYITYNRKGGGLVRMYETSDITTTPLNRLMDGIEESHIYHDNYRDDGFSSEAFKKDGTTIVADSVDKNLLAEAVAIMKGH